MERKMAKNDESQEGRVFFYNRKTLQNYRLSPYARITGNSCFAVFDQTLFGLRLRVNISLQGMQPFLNRMSKGCTRDEGIELLKQTNVSNANGLFDILIQGGVLE